MKKILPLLALILGSAAHAQITITAADMPVAGDMLSYSIASPTSSTISLADSGAGINWNYTFTPIGHGVDTYQTAFSVNPLYVITIGATAYGYKVADAFPLPLPGITINQVYTFFEKKSSPSRYQAQAFAANISGIPTPINYSKPDVWYFFPLGYTDQDSSNYALNIALPTLGSIKQVGYRKTRVDGWGTITTPFYTTAANCIRVRSEIHEIDSVQISPLPSIGFPRNSVEYKWLVNGEHYPALWVTANMGPGGSETISSIRYRDNPAVDTPPVDNSVKQVYNTISEIKAWPNPSGDGNVTVAVPADWNTFAIELYDLASRQVAVYANQRTINVHSLPAGSYVGRVISGSNVAYVKIER